MSSNIPSGQYLEFSDKLFCNRSSSKQTNLPYYSDKVLLPETVLKQLLNEQKALNIKSLPHPLIFRLSTPSNQCYAGVREFISSEGEIELPGLLADKLGILKDAMSTPVIVQLVNEVKSAKTLVLTPEMVYSQFTSDQDWKWFLEAKLTSLYTTLTQGDDLIIKDDSSSLQIYKLKVSKTSPGRTVCIIDTDIDLDITPLNNEMAERLSAGKAKRDVEFLAVKVDDVATASVENSQKLLINITPNIQQHGLTISADVDFAISGNRLISQDLFLKSTLSKGDKELIINAGNKLLDGANIYVIPMGREFVEAKFKICSADRKIVEVHNEDSEGTTSHDSSYVQCAYCKSWILKRSQLMHENFCRRNNIPCDKGCGRVFLRKIPETHWHCCSTYGDSTESLRLHKEYCHEGPVTCPKCDEKFSNKQELCRHRDMECPKSLHECRFCHLIVPRGEQTPETGLLGMSAHEFTCGAKTTECRNCGKVIRRMDMESHHRLHELDRVSRSEPIVCSNQNCTRIISQTGAQNVLGLCNVCFGPLYSSAYDPKHVKLRSRLERKYIIQMQHGCGNNWCDNTFCRSSKRFAWKNIQLSDIIKFVRSDLVPRDVGEHREYKFCVDETITRQKHLEETLLEDPDFSEYGKGWICEGLNSVSAGEENANRIVPKLRGWLMKYGVKKSEY